jgi:hypothetical protein
MKFFRIILEFVESETEVIIMLADEVRVAQAGGRNGLPQVAIASTVRRAKRCQTRLFGSGFGNPLCATPHHSALRLCTE